MLYRDNSEKEAKEFPCWECGKMVKFYCRPKERVFCEKCSQKHIREHEDDIKRYEELKVKLMHENAIRKLEKASFVYVSDYRQAIEDVREMEIMRPDAFLSAEEIIMAILLYAEGYDFKINYKILNYKVDFYIPLEHICLEIDSALHDIGKCRAKDGRRDIEIRNHLGKEWETVRIPTNYVEKYPTKVIPAMIELADKQRKLRQENGGMIPGWYSKSAKAYYDSICPDVLQRIYKK